MAVSEEKRVDLLLAPIEELGKYFRLVLGLSTGAVVLFVNLLNTTRIQRGVAAILVTSIFSFGMAAMVCLHLVARLVQVRAILAHGVREDKELGHTKTADQELKDWEKSAGREGKILMYCFNVGIFSASMFILFLVITR